MTHLRIIGWSLVVLSLAGCVEKDTTPVTEYFWPLEEGRVFVYQLLPGDGRHLITLKKVTRDADGIVRVETAGRFEGKDIPKPPDVAVEDLRDTATFLINPKQNIIYSAFGDATPRGILLKGPVAIGTKWDRVWKTTGSDFAPDPSGQQEKVPRWIEIKGQCQIESILPQVALGKTTSCVKIRCSMTLKTLTETSQESFCKGIGFMEEEKRGTYNGIKMPQAISTRLIEVK